MKSARSGSRKFWIAAGLTIAATLILVSCIGGVAPAIVNWLLQPWDWAKRQMFGAILNTFHLTPFEGVVNWSTGNVDKFFYLLINIVQTFVICIEESGLYISPENRKLLDSCRTIAYAIEIPINGLYNWNHFSDGDARENNFFIRVALVAFFTALNTLIFEWTIGFVFKAIKGVVGVFFDNKVHNSQGA